MAQTPAAVQTALGVTGMNATILLAMESNGTIQEWYVDGRADVPGRVRWCTTTASGSAAVQAAAILASLRTG